MVNNFLITVNCSDFPEMMADRAPSPLQVICTSGEPDHKRWACDFILTGVGMSEVPFIVISTELFFKFYILSLMHILCDILSRIAVHTVFCI
jgi:hypothetical protein